ncbi:MAG: SAM-dependent methyltransferase [Acidimicrobiales bacterium]
MNELERRLAARIRRHGPIPFDEVVEAALYDPEHGFYATTGRAGRRTGDFITSPEVGPLFGAVIARALDTWWQELDRPDPYVVIEAGAGAGTLARAVLAAEPESEAALEYVLVERPAVLRAHHGGLTSRAEFPPVDGPCVVLANELLDNLPFGLAERRDGVWHDVVVDVDGDRLVERLGPASGLEARAFEAPDGARIPVQGAAMAWLTDALAVAHGGRVVVIDFADNTASMARRPWTEWLRTYRAHGRGDHPLVQLGTQDITVEVAVDHLAAIRPPDHDRTQAEFLAAHGIDGLVADGRRIWAERAHLGDLAAVRARSRVTEAAALTDPAGLGAFRVLEWVG